MNIILNFLNRDFFSITVLTIHESIESFFEHNDSFLNNGLSFSRQYTFQVHFRDYIDSLIL